MRGKPDGDDAKADSDTKGSKDADSERRRCLVQQHQIQMKNGRMNG